jgi:hypothetical protein
MIDGISARRRQDNLHPSVKNITDNIVTGDHTKDTFKPPAEVAAAEEQQGSSGTASNLLPDASGGGTPVLPPKNKRSFGEWLRGLSPKKKILLTVLAVILVAGAAVGAYFLFFAESAPKPLVAQKNEPKPEPVPTTVASNLTGLQVDPNVNERPVTAIMIENSVVARPQSGLNQAGVVFEAIAEGGITRFVALFQDTKPSYIGPVRSARPYFMQWMLGFDAAYAHAGGSAKALSYIKKWHVKDLQHHASYFHRVTDRAAPHNLYTSIKDLNKYEKEKGFGKAKYTPLPRKEKEAPSATPTAQTIDFNISSANYNVHYDYDPAANNYKRSVGGAKHKDEKTGGQLTPKVVVALIMPQGKDGIYYTYSTLGSGKAYIFQDGIVSIGTWKKKNNDSNLTFVDANGDLLRLNPGQTWFTALGESSRVSYKP